MWAGDLLRSLVSFIESLENDQHKCRRKFEPEGLKVEMEEANNYFQQQNKVSVLVLYGTITPVALWKPATAQKSCLASSSASWLHRNQSWGHNTRAHICTHPFLPQVNLTYGLHL